MTTGRGAAVKLVRAEWLRLYHRAMVRWLMVALVALCAANGIGTAVSWARPSPESLAQMQAAQNATAADWRAEGGLEQQAQCYQDEAAQRAADPTLGQDYMGCAYMDPSYQPVWQDPELRYAITTAIDTLPVIAGVVAFFLCALMITSEFGSRAMGTWLTYEPRRRLVYATKVGVPAVTGALLTIPTAALLIAGPVIVWAANGYPMDVPAGFWLSIVAQVARTVGWVGLAGLAAGALAFLLRHLWLTIAAPVAYLLVTEGLIGSFTILGGATNGPLWLQHFMLSNDSVAAIAGTRIFGQAPACSAYDIGSCTIPATITITWWQGWLVLGAATALVLVAGWLVFRRRDVS